MCDDHWAMPDPEPRPHPAPGLSRRGLLGLGARGLAAAALLPGASRLLGAGPAYADTTADGRLVVPMAMHVHGSFSEGVQGSSASWETQLQQAAQTGVKIVWPTDHDWRMSAFHAPDVFSTSALQERVKASTYTWRPQATGALSSSTATVVPSPSSPSDPSAQKGSLHVAAVSSGAVASQRLWLDGSADNHPQRTNIGGQTVRVQVLPQQVGPDAWAEVLVTLSHHPARSGRPAGDYQLSYRLTTAGSRSVSAQGLLGIVTVPVQAGQWNEVVLDLTADTAAAWPDLVAADNSLVDLWVGATSRGGAPAEACFAYLRFTRSRTNGAQPLQAQSQILDAYAGRFGGLAVRGGVEISVGPVHINGFGGDRELPDYTHGDARQQVNAPAAEYIAWSAQLVHGYGGLASLNHPFGSTSSLTSPSQQDTARQGKAKRMLASRAYGIDILEVGYRKRGGASLETHLALWDTLSRGGVWLTGNGVNDSHGGPNSDWTRLDNRFVTTALADTTSESDLLAALSAGRVYVSEQGTFSGVLQISAGSCPMGSVSVRPGLTSRALTIRATGLPSGSVVQVVQGPVDYSGAVDPGTSVTATLPASAFSTGAASVPVDVRRSTFVRAQVVRSDGSTVAFTNPVWLLQEKPPVAPPPARRSPDSTA